MIRHTHTHVFSHGETEDIWQQTAEHSTASNSPTYPTCASSNCFAWSIKSPLKRPEPADTRESLSAVICTEGEGKEKETLAHDANIAFTSWQEYCVQKELRSPQQGSDWLQFKSKSGDLELVRTGSHFYVIKVFVYMQILHLFIALWKTSPP